MDPDPTDEGARDEQARPQAPQPQGQRREPRQEAERLSRRRPAVPAADGPSTTKAPDRSVRGLSRRARRSVALLHPHLGDPGPQLLGSGLAGAAAANHRLDHLVEVVLRQARRALLEVLLDLSAVQVVHLAVEVLVDPVQDLAAVGRVGLAAAHDAPPDSTPAWTRPRSRA